jgi:UDP-N-acetyl-D-mannosaminuronic acid dehydrogenase
VAFYRTIVQADLDVADIITAELVKTTENTYRDVQIAFANEVALICQAIGADVWRVRELVNKTPLRQMHLPGAGVGGHCIPKDPWLLASSVEYLVPLHLIPAARAVNDGMPKVILDMAVEELRKVGKPVNLSRIAVLGYAYLENSDDTRNSPSETLVTLFREMGASVEIHDPFVPDYQKDLQEMAQDCDAAILMVGHNAYKKFDLHSLKNALRLPILVDGRGFFDAIEARNAGLVYRCIGQGG